MLDHLFYGKQTTLVSETSSGIGIWTKMPGEELNSKNKDEISYIQKIMAQMLIQAPKNMGFIYITGASPDQDMDRIILPDFYDEPIKNDPENCHLYDYMTEMKLDTIEGQRRAAILSSLVSHLICSYEGYGLRIRYFEFWNKKRISVKIYTPKNESGKNFLEKINLGINLSFDEIVEYEEKKTNRKKLMKLRYEDENNWEMISNRPDANDKEILLLGYLNKFMDLFDLLSDKYKCMAPGHLNLGHFEIYGIASRSFTRYTDTKPRVEIENEFYVSECFFHEMTSQMRKSMSAILTIIDPSLEEKMKGDQSYLKLSPYDFYKVDDGPKCKYHLDIHYNQGCKNMIYLSYVFNTRSSRLPPPRSIETFCNPDYSIEQNEFYHYEQDPIINNEKQLYHDYCQQKYYLDTTFKREFSDLCLVDINVDPELAERMLRCVYKNDYGNLRKIEIITDSGKIVHNKKSGLDNPQHKDLADLILSLKKTSEQRYEENDEGEEDDFDEDQEEFDTDGDDDEETSEHEETDDD